MTERVNIAEDDIVTLARGVRLVDDKTRGTKVLLAPERTMGLDAIAVSIVEALDGKATVGDIITDLAQAYGAAREEVCGDVIEFINELQNRRLIEVI